MSDRIVRAFLSHSSTDKEFVRGVVRELGDLACVFDERSFESGAEFRTSIEEHLEDSDVLVLFASKNSIKSDWVKFELDEAWYQKLRGRLSHSLVFLMDDHTHYSDLPTWLQRARVDHIQSAKTAARTIQTLLNRTLAAIRPRPFVGRGREIKEIEEQLQPLDGSDAPRAIFISGLPGIGRKTLVSNTVSSHFLRQQAVQISIPIDCTPADIAVLLKSEVTRYNTLEARAAQAKRISALDDDAALVESIDALASISRSRELPVLVDSGGILDEDGYVRKPIASLLAAIPDPHARVVIVSNRRPKGREDQWWATTMVRELGESDMKRLILILAEHYELSLRADQATEVASSCRGYPPSAYFAVSWAREYGADALIADKHPLVRNRSRAFVKHLSGLSIDSPDEQILVTLASYSPIPHSTLSRALGIDSVTLSRSVVKLVDLALIETTDLGYTISKPIEAAVTSVFGFASFTTASSIADSLAATLRAEQDNVPLELMRVMFRASLFSDRSDLQQTVFGLASDLIAVAERHYHARDYELAAKMALLAVEQRPESGSAREYLVKSLVKLERWDEADREINNSERYIHKRRVAFLRGFSCRSQNRRKDAISHYKQAEAFGHGGVALNRELASCYLHEGKLGEARKHAKKALKSDPDNRYVLDLMVQIAEKIGDEDLLSSSLAKLELVETDSFVNHRRSRVEARRGNKLGALKSARKACAQTDRAPFHMIANLANLELEARNWDRGEQILSTISRRFRRQRHDVQRGLWAKLHIGKRRFAMALGELDKIVDADTHPFRLLYRQAIEGRLAQATVPDDERAGLEAELARIEAEEALPDDFTVFEDLL